MERLFIPPGTSALAGKRKRALALGQEEAAAATPAPAGKEQSLSGYVPSALIPTDKQMLALAIGGAPAWSRRLRRIDEMTEGALSELGAAWQALAQIPRQDATRFAAQWRAQAERQDFTQVNELIRRHNLYFPAEANLRMSVRTGDYIGIGGGDYRRRLLDAAWILERFPADLAAALA